MTLLEALKDRDDELNMLQFLAVVAILVAVILS